MNQQKNENMSQEDKGLNFQNKNVKCCTHLNNHN